MVRKSKGRQKVEMVKMANESNLQVTFSKRRSGLFKKASELCTLCGAEVAIIVFSPGKKVFSFGHPSVETLVDRFLSRNPSHHHHHHHHQQASGTMQLIEAHRNANVRELNTELTHVTGQLEAEKKRADELNQMKKASQAQCWWEGPLEGMEGHQLEQLKGSLEDLRKNVSKQTDRVMIQNTNPSQFFVGSSSSSSHQAGHMVPNVGFNGNHHVIPPHMAPHGWNPAYGRFF